MAEGIDYSRYVGRVLFPRGPYDLLRTTQCPACFTALQGTRCPGCGLELAHPSATELAATSAEAAAMLDRRLELIGRMRYDQAAAPAPAADSAATVPMRLSTADALVAPGATRSLAPADRTTTAESAPPSSGLQARAAGSEPAQPRRSSVQLILLLVGVSLLSIAAIFFLVYAFITFGIIWRSVIIAALTAATIGIASWLRGRQLTATAEGLASFGVVLVLLDAYALWANDLLGSGSIEGMRYWGGALLVSAVAFAIWHRATELRVPNIAAFTLIAPGAGLLIAGLAEGEDPLTRLYLALAAAAAAGLSHSLVGEQAVPERAIVLAFSGLGLVSAAFVVPAVWPGADWAPTGAALALAAIAAALAQGLLRTRGAEPLALVAAGITGVAAAGAALPGVARALDEDALVSIPAIAAAVIALSLERVASRPALRVAMWSAAATAALLALVPGLVVALRLGTLLDSVTSRPWSVDLDAALPGNARDGSTQAAALALGAIAAMLVLFWAGGRVLTARLLIAVWTVAVAAVAAVLAASALVLALVIWLALAAGFVLVAGRLSADSPYRRPLLGSGFAALALGYFAAWLSRDAWWWVSLAAIATLLSGRRVLRAPATRAAATGVAALVVVAGAAAIPPFLGEDSPFETPGYDAALFATAAAVAMLLAAATLPTLHDLDRRVLFWAATPLGAATAALSWGLGRDPAGQAALLAPGVASGVVALAGGAALLLWLRSARTGEERVERVSASLLIGPTVYWALDSLATLVGFGDLADTIVPSSAALLVATGALAVATRRPGGRLPRDIGAALVGVPTLLTALNRADETAWIVLLIAAVAVLVVAISPDGLAASASPRRHLGWLALALAVAGLWWRLGSVGVDGLEPYLLPVTAALLAVAAYLAVRRPRERLSPLLVLAGLLVSVLPLAINAIDITGETAPRAIALWSVCAVMVLADSWLRGPAALLRYADAAALAGLGGLFLVGIGRAVVIAAERPGTAVLEADAWAVATLVVAVGAAMGQAAARDDGNDEPRQRAAQGIVLLALGSVAAVSLVDSDLSRFDELRAIGFVLLFAAAHVISLLVDRVPFTRLVGWVSIGLAGVAAVDAIANHDIDPFELATAPIALALLATGIDRMRSDATARSWPWLGPGIAALLLPSLAVTIDDRPVWRLAGLGVVGVAVIVVGLQRRLQAPFVLGTAVVLVHALATFAPQIRAVYESVEWWLWLGAGGLLLIVLAARYERRLRDLRAITRRVASLR